MVILAIALVQVTRADSTVQEAQQELKEQGYYFGQISGEKDADTTAAIRRFQIRSGLPVTGELDEDTLHALRSGAVSSSASTPTPQPQRVENSAEEQSGEVTPPPRDAFNVNQFSESPGVTPASSLRSDLADSTMGPAPRVSGSDPRQPDALSGLSGTGRE